MENNPFKAESVKLKVALYENNYSNDGFELTKISFSKKTPNNKANMDNVSSPDMMANDDSKERFDFDEITISNSMELTSIENKEDISNNILNNTTSEESQQQAIENPDTEPEEEPQNEEITVCIRKFINNEKIFLEYFTPLIDIYLPKIKVNLSSQVKQHLPGLFQVPFQLFENVYEFYTLLQECDNNLSQFCEVFKSSSTSLFKMYYAFAVHRTEINYAVKGLRDKSMIFNLDLAGYFHKPFDRLNNYIEFWRVIESNLDASHQKLDLVKSLKATTQNNVEKITAAFVTKTIFGSEFSLQKYGRYIMHHNFFCLKPKQAESVTAFLLEDIILIASRINDKHNVIQTYNFVTSIIMDGLKIFTMDNNKHVLELENTNTKTCIVLTAETESLKKLWQNTIAKRLLKNDTEYKEKIHERITTLIKQNAI